MANKKKEEFRKKLAEDFIGILQDEKRNWKKEWSSFGKFFNPSSGTKYKGINEFRLALTSMVEGYTDPRFLTYNQVADKGYKLVDAKGKGVQIEYFSYYDFENKTKISPAEYWDLKSKGHNVNIFTNYSVVFNAKHIEGIPELITEKGNKDIEAAKIFEKISENMNVPFIEDGGDRAFYRPSTNDIHIPKKETFFTQYAYESTLAHEFSHATGSKELLDREVGKLFGDQQYAYEELVAEMSAAFFCTKTDLPTDENLDNHKAYVQSWVKGIKNRPDALVEAVKDAEKSCTTLEYYGELISLDEAEQKIGHDYKFLQKEHNKEIIVPEELTEEEREMLERETAKYWRLLEPYEYTEELECEDELEM